jgi:hypothetical protein
MLIIIKLVSQHHRSVDAIKPGRAILPCSHWLSHKFSCWSTAGLEFAIELARQIRGEAAARHFERVLEYDPKPPFAAGTPELAGATLTERRPPP